MQPSSIRFSQPQFGTLSPAARQAIMQAQYGFSAKDAVALTQQGDTFLNRYFTTMIPSSLAGLGAGLLGSRSLANKPLRLLIPLLGLLSGLLVASLIHWPEAKKLYAAMRDKSTRQYPAYLDKIYGYQQNP